MKVAAGRAGPGSTKSRRCSRAAPHPASDDGRRLDPEAARGALDRGRLLPARIGPIRPRKVPIILTLALLTRSRGA